MYACMGRENRQGQTEGDSLKEQLKAQCLILEETREEFSGSDMQAKKSVLGF